MLGSLVSNDVRFLKDGAVLLVPKLLQQGKIPSVNSNNDRRIDIETLSNEIIKEWIELRRYC